ncbi:MAG: hypothetical protein Kow0065_03860 [Methylomicrobium sp.]
MRWPYRLLIGFLLLGGLAFGLGPWYTLRAIAEAAAGNDAEAWPGLVVERDLQITAGKLMQGMLDVKMYADMAADPVGAMRDNTQGMEMLKFALRHLTAPAGFNRLMCGEMAHDSEPVTAAGCWRLDGTIEWLSPVLARVVFVNPETHWQTGLLLTRTGLFRWQATGIELPAEAILARFAAGLQ